jgi:hypothetical protein
MSHQFSRRYFFYGSLLAGAVPAGGFGSTPSLPAVGYKSINEKLNVACVGCGVRSEEILWGVVETENLVALCDPNDAADRFREYPNVKRYKDYRKMLEQDKNIDAVMVAVPDHQHAPITLTAMQHGKHVYCEKPLTRTPSEVRMFAEAAAKYGVATQMGNQGWNHEGTKTACEIFWSGEIGEVREVYAWASGGGGPRNAASADASQKSAAPSGLDWDLWLGPAPLSDYDPAKMSSWRSYIDYSTGGSLGDWQVHILGPAHLALQLDKVSPKSVECVAVEGKSGLFWPSQSHLVWEFPARGSMPPVTVHACQGVRGDFKTPAGVGENDRITPPSNNLAEKGRPFYAGGDGVMLVGKSLTIDGKPSGPGAGRPSFPRANQVARGPAAAPGAPGAVSAAGARGAAGRGGQQGNTPGQGSVFVGSKGHIATSGRGEGVWLLPASRWAEYKLPPQVLPRGINHQQDWLRACKGGAPGVSQFSLATKYLEWLVLGSIAMRVPGKLNWDGKNMRFTNSPEANKYLQPFVRKGWEYKV